MKRKERHLMKSLCMKYTAETLLHRVNRIITRIPNIITRITDILTTIITWFGYPMYIYSNKHNHSRVAQYAWFLPAYPDLSIYLNLRWGYFNLHYVLSPFSLPCLVRELLFMISVVEAMSHFSSSLNYLSKFETAQGFKPPLLLSLLLLLLLLLVSWLLW